MPGLFEGSFLGGGGACFWGVGWFFWGFGGFWFVFFGVWGFLGFLGGVWCFLFSGLVWGGFFFGGVFCFEGPFIIMAHGSPFNLSIHPSCCAPSLHHCNPPLPPPLQPQVFFGSSCCSRCSVLDFSSALPGRPFILFPTPWRIFWL